MLCLMTPGFTLGSLQPTPRSTGHRLASTRRALLLGAASLPLASVVPAALGTAPRASLLGEAEVAERARTDTLTTERVILRALRDELIPPSDIDECDLLLKVENIDKRAADEVARTNGELLKLRAATQDTPYAPEYLRAVEKTYDLGRLVEQRIRERLSQINFKVRRSQPLWTLAPAIPNVCLAVAAVPK